MCKAGFLGNLLCAIFGQPLSEDPVGGPVKKSLLVVIATILMLTLVSAPASAGPNDLTVDGQPTTLDATNAYRSANSLVMYTPDFGDTTGTNEWGYEVAVVDGKITDAEHLKGNMPIPDNGFVLSGHGEARVFLYVNAQVGDEVVLDAPAPPPPPPPPPPPAPADGVTVNGTETRALDGTDVYRKSGFLVRYTPAYGATTGTNQWGYEVAVVGGKVIAAENLVGNMEIPQDGYVLSGHGASRVWLFLNAKEGSTVALGDDEPPPPPVDPGDPPAAVTEERFLEDDPNCTAYTVTVTHQKRTNSWQWDGTEWVDNWSKWMTHHVEDRGATAEDCPVLDDGLPANVALPDIQIKNLDKCGRGDLDLTGGDCFMIVNPGPYVSDFPHLEGRKLLKFPVLTMNVGDGPMEIVANRTSHYEEDWVAYQRYFDAAGNEVAVREIPEVEFYFAGDGHDHWHFTDFDDYRIETLDGNVVGSAEKHGYCLYSNTSYTPMKGLPGVPDVPTYTYEDTCGQGLPQAISIIQGLDKGWGDTYPATLPDQVLDITDVPDGRYRVSVTADDLGAVTELNENNQTVSMEITIQGDEVTTHPETATGGLD